MIPNFHIVVNVDVLKFIGLIFFPDRSIEIID